MEVKYLYRFLSLAYQRKIHIEPEIDNLWVNLADEREVNMGPYKNNGYSIYRAPGSRLIVGHGVELFMVGTYNFFIICIITTNRVSHWKFVNILETDLESYFNYENFFYWPKYKSLANFVYNMFNNVQHDYEYDALLEEQPWKLFKSHMAFSPDCVLGDKGPSHLCALKLCCNVYGEYDDENLTSDILWDVKPWEVTSCLQVLLLIEQTTLIKEAWKCIEEYARMNIFLGVEYLLCSIKNPFIDEGYKFAEIALDTNNVELYDWATRKYKLDKGRMKWWLDIFPPNNVSSKIRN